LAHAESFLDDGNGRPQTNAEECGRWFADFKRVQAQVDEAVDAFRDYCGHAQAIVDLRMTAAKVDKEISRINGSAPNGVHRRIRPVELQARGLDQFDRDHPSLAATVLLPDWDVSSRNVWPLTHPNSLALICAESMIPYHPGGACADDDLQAQRRTDVQKEQREIAE
jgi:hypothetical protein